MHFSHLEVDHQWAKGSLLMVVKMHQRFLARNARAEAIFQINAAIDFLCRSDPARAALVEAGEKPWFDAQVYAGVDAFNILHGARNRYSWEVCECSRSSDVPAIL